MADKSSSNLLTGQPGKSNIFLIGFMGSGKSHWGKIWAEENKCSFVDLDEVIEKMAGRSIAQIFEINGEDYFRKLEAETLRSCASLQNTLIASGGGTPCYYDNMEWMNANGITIYLTCTAQDVLKRVAEEQEKRPLIKKLNPAELLFFIEQKLAERFPFYSRATYTVSSNTLTPASLPAIISTK
ncbi:MAG: shikimate kinase [Ferruginibacter sp.]